MTKCALHAPKNRTSMLSQLGEFHQLLLVSECFLSVRECLCWLNEKLVRLDLEYLSLFYHSPNQIKILDFVVVLVNFEGKYNS